MKPFDETRREEEKWKRDEERARGIPEDSMQALGERLASGWGSVVLRSGGVSLAGRRGDGGNLRRLSGSGKPVYLMPLDSWSGTSWMAEAIVRVSVVSVQ